MKLFTKGFTLIELMIVIAIIGILAAALFPLMTNYMARSRDTARIADVTQISLAAINRYTDKGSYPAPTATNCVNETLLQPYMQKVPKDPILRVTSPCSLVDGSYAFATGSSASGTGTAFVIASSMEIGGNANSTGAITPNFNATTFAAYTVAVKNGYATGYYIIAR